MHHGQQPDRNLVSNSEPELPSGVASEFLTHRHCAREQMLMAALSHYNLGVIFGKGNSFGNEYVFSIFGTSLLSNSDIETQVSRHTVFYTVPPRNVWCRKKKKKKSTFCCVV